MPLLPAATRESLAGGRSSFRTPPIPITTGTSASTPNATRPTLAARILDDEQRITRIVNNYSKISFNFGPTLLSWMKPNSARDSTTAIMDADRQSQKQFSGSRLGPGAGLQPHDHAAGQRPRQIDAGPLGASRFCKPLWPPAGRHVASRNRRRISRRWISGRAGHSSSPFSPPTRRKRYPPT